MSGIFFDGERGSDELMVINDAVPGDIDFRNYAFELFIRQVGVTLTHGQP